MDKECIHSFFLLFRKKYDKILREESEESMKVTFYSNFLTHHQLPFCLEMQKRLGDDFKFVSTVKVFQWRLDMGFEDLDSKYDFVIRAYESDEMYQKAKQLALESDIIMIGSTTDDLIVERLRQDKITFRYRSRIFYFPDGFLKTVLNKDKMQLFHHRHIKFRNNKNLYMLCANAYGAKDFNALGLYKNKTYKWGYFLKTNYYDIEKLIENKEKNEIMQIVWVARFIKWKHPEVVLRLANELKKKQFSFHIKMLGAGILEDKIKQQIKQMNLEDVVEMVGHVPSEKVKDYMEAANIFIGTSDKNEGWGAVINESMNAGCAIVANEQMGSVPLLIKNGETGFIYKTYSEFEDLVIQLMKDKELRKKISVNAYKYITSKWTAELAAENLIHLFDCILNQKEYTLTEGPASKL